MNLLMMRILKIDFHRHCAQNNLKGVNDCLSRGVDVNTVNVDGTGYSALMVACSSGSSAVVARLVQQPGLDVNYQDENGVTAAILAVEKGHTAGE